MRPCRVPRCTMRPPTGRWVSSTVNSSSSVAASRMSPGRRPVRHARRRTASGRARARRPRRPRPAARPRAGPRAPGSRWRRGRWPPSGPRRSWSRSRGRSYRRRTWRCRRTAPSPPPAATGRPCGPSATGAAAPRARPRTRPVDAHPVLGGELHRQVDGEAVGVVEPEGDLARQHGRILGQALGTATDHPLGARERDERLLEVAVPASRVLANAVSSRRMVPRMTSRRSRRMGYASPIVSMTTAAVSTRNGSRRPRSRP